MEDLFLSRIRPEYYESIRGYRKEMLEAGSSMDGTCQLASYDDIEKWALNAALFEDETTVPPGYGISFEYVYVWGNEVAGMVNLRPKAMEHVNLATYGGHIGYSVRPSLRNRGIATAMLRDTLKICRERFGLREVLITCNRNNTASRKVILANGGRHEGDVFYAPEGEYLERYWISL